MTLNDWIRKHGVSHFNQYRKENPDVELDFSEELLEELFMDGINLDGVNLSGSMFVRCNLYEAHFDGACMEGVVFSDCDMPWVQCIGVDIKKTGVTITGCEVGVMIVSNPRQFYAENISGHIFSTQTLVPKNVKRPAIGGSVLQH